MKIIVLLAYIITSGVIAYQDFKTRSIHILVFAFLLLISIGFHFFVGPFDWLEIALNLTFLVVLYALAFLASKLVLRKSIRLGLGMGDVIYVLTISIFFGFPSFIIWLNIGLVFSLLVHLLMKSVFNSSSGSKQLIPLAGYLAIIFTVALLFEIYVGSIAEYIY